jgi:hypothetical protein
LRRRSGEQHQRGGDPRWANAKETALGAGELHIAEPVRCSWTLLPGSGGTNDND